MSLGKAEKEYLQEKLKGIGKLADLFKAFADETRVSLLYALFLREFSVGELAEILGTSQSNVSHHLRFLKDASLVKGRRDGRKIIYALDDEHVTQIMKMGIDHINHI